MKKLYITIGIFIIVGAYGLWSLNLEKEFVGGQFDLTSIELNLAGEKVIIGDNKSLDFKPQVTLEKWGGEDYLKIWSDDTGDTKATESNGKIIWQTDKKEYNFYTTTLDGNEVFEYEIILKEKPVTNVITLNIETSGFEFYYQPELTQKQIDNGFSRPDNVVGSYAVYHKTKKNHIIGQTNYKAGKAYHIYTPQMEDSIGTKVWGDLHIENGILTVTIPQSFLDKAVYPVKHASGLRFGYDEIGGSNIIFGDNLKYLGAPYDSRFGTDFAMPEDGTLNSLHVALRADSGVTRTMTVAAVINEEDSDGANSHGQIEIKENVDQSITSSSAFITFTMAGTTSLTNGTNYVLNTISDGSTISATDAIILSHDTVGENVDGHSTQFPDLYAYSTTDDPWDPITTNDADSIISIYATYEAVAPTPRTLGGEDVIWF